MRADLKSDLKVEFESGCLGYVYGVKIGWIWELYVSGDALMKSGRALTLIGAIRKCEKFHADIENDIEGWEIL